MNYQINFDKIELLNITKFSENEYAGVIVSSNANLQAEMDIKPQTREWWIDLGKKIGGEFEKKVLLYTTK